MHGYRDHPAAHTALQHLRGDSQNVPSWAALPDREGVNLPKSLCVLAILVPARSECCDASGARASTGTILAELLKRQCDHRVPFSRPDLID